MEIEKPKVQNSKEINKHIELMGLIYSVFDQTEAGKKLLEEFKRIYVSDVTFPTNFEAIKKQYGSVEIYTGFKEGQKNLVLWINMMINEYKKLPAK